MQFHLHTDAPWFVARVTNSRADEIEAALGALMHALMVPSVVRVRRAKEPQHPILEGGSSCSVWRDILLFTCIEVDCDPGGPRDRSGELTAFRGNAPAGVTLVVRIDITRLDRHFVHEEPKACSPLVRECGAERSQ